MTEVLLQWYSGEHVLTLLDDLADIYTDAHSGNPNEDDELFSRSSFIARTAKQAEVADFKLVTALSDTDIIGFSFGYPLPPGRWWSDCTQPSREIFDSAKFAVIELDVRRSRQRQGVGRRLLESLLSDRTERFATLAATPGSVAYAMYMRWGWHKAGAFETPPIMDALALRLNGLNPPGGLRSADGPESVR